MAGFSVSVLFKLSSVANKECMYVYKVETESELVPKIIRILYVVASLIQLY